MEVSSVLSMFLLSCPRSTITVLQISPRRIPHLGFQRAGKGHSGGIWPSWDEISSCNTKQHRSLQKHAFNRDSVFQEAAVVGRTDYSRCSADRGSHISHERVGISSKTLGPSVLRSTGLHAAFVRLASQERNVSLRGFGARERHGTSRGSVAFT